MIKKWNGVPSSCTYTIIQDGSSLNQAECVCSLKRKWSWMRSVIPLMIDFPGKHAYWDILYENRIKQIEVELVCLSLHNKWIILYIYIYIYYIGIGLFKSE